MNTPHRKPRTTAVIFTSLLLVLQTNFAFGQTADAPPPATAPTQPAEAPAKSSAVDQGSANKVITMEAVTVTTGRTVPKAIDDIPGAITLISHEDIQQQLLINNDATSVLQFAVPGYGPSSQSLQNAGETLRGRVALRLFDGVPMSTPLREGSRSAYFSDMSVIGRIEVINGPSAAEGVGAAGGIINYISKDPVTTGAFTTLKYSKQAESGSGDWKVGFEYDHKDRNFDALLYAGFLDQGLTYDAHGRAIGFHTSGATADSKTNELFAKLGTNFGAENDQRVQLTVSRFDLRGKGNYTFVLGDRTLGLSNTVQRQRDNLPVYNDMYAYSLGYTNSRLAGGTLTAKAYRSSEAMGFVSTIDPSKQDPLIAPIGTLIDQSEVNSQKHGVHLNWTGDDLFNVTGLGMSVGSDFVEDTSQQRLAAANRTWAPPVKYDSVAPYAQVDYKKGPITLSGGIRHEGGKLHVDTFTTIYTAGRTLVTGGTLKYSEYLPNIGVVVRLPYDWSLFASHSVGFSLPDVGVALRGISRPGQSVASLFGELRAVIVKANEVGANWRGARGSFGGSYYQTSSKFGSTLITDPVLQDFVLARLPVDVKGYEFNGEFKFTQTLSVTGLYSHAQGWTATTSGGIANVPLGLLTISPDKTTWALNWKFDKNERLQVGTTTFFDRKLTSNNGPEDFHGYTLLDVSASFETKWGTFSLGIENALNKYYILPNSQFIGFQNYYAGRGRVFSLTHNYKF